jgi:hypothetical protein
MNNAGDDERTVDSVDEVLKDDDCEYVRRSE